MLLKPIGDVFGFWPPATTATTQPLPPLQPSRESVQIEFTFLERPVGDPLLGNALWSQIDQVGHRQPGPKPNHSSNSACASATPAAVPSPALERMLKESQPDDAQASDTHIAVKKETLCIGPGVSPPITTNTLHKCTLDVPLTVGTKEGTYENFKSVLRLTAHRQQDGWARLEFVPEIHFGQERLRPMSANAGLQSIWQPEMAQEVETLLSHRFSVTLHVGEIVIITADATEKPRLFGTQAFVRDQPGTGALQRVLLLRLANMNRINPVYAQPGPGISSGR